MFLRRRTLARAAMLGGAGYLPAAGGGGGSAAALPGPSALSTVLAGLCPGQTVAVTIVPADGANATVDVTWGSCPDLA